MWFGNGRQSDVSRLGQNLGEGEGGGKVAWGQVPKDLMLQPRWGHGRRSASGQDALTCS